MRTAALQPRRLLQTHQGLQRRILHTGRACLRAMAAPRDTAGCPFLAGVLGSMPTNPMDAPAPARPWTPPPMSDASSCTAEEYEAIARELVQVAQQTEGLPKLFRLGFHTSGHWSAQGRTGGPNGGWHRFPVDYESPKNAGLKPTILALTQLKERHPRITWADLATFGAAVAVEAGGGPPIAWYPGRRDALGPGPSHPPFSQRLAPGDYSPSGVMDFYTNMGMSVREAVVLNAGGHSMGGADKDGSGWDGSFTPFDDSWPTPANKHLLDLLRYGWTTEVVEETSRVQFVLAPGQDTTYTTEGGAAVIRFPTDMAIRTACAFSYWAVAYARNEAAFVKDFQRAFQRMLQLGAGETWEVDQSYQWKGLKGDFEGFGPSIAPHLDTEDIPAGAPGAPGSAEHQAFLAGLAQQLADPSRPLASAL